ncbi:hypothetical protein [Streptomyces sp. NPDC054962]
MMVSLLRKTLHRPAGGQSVRSALMPFAVASLSAVTLLLTGCSSSDGGGIKDEGSGGAAGSEEDQAVQYRKCLRENGLNVPDPKPDEPGVIPEGDPKVLEKAYKACADKAGPDAGAGSPAADKDKALKFAQCMRKEGVNMPDPKDGALPALQPPEGKKAETYAKALKACEGILR